MSRSYAKLLLAVDVRPRPRRDLHAHVEGLRDDAAVPLRRMRENAENLAEIRLLSLRIIDFRRLGDEEEHPDRRGDRADRDVRNAHPEELVVDDRVQGGLVHRLPLGDRRRIEVREDQLLREEDACERSDRVEHLREVKATDGRRLVAEREDVRVARRLQDRAAARDDEDADDERPEALGDRRGNVKERPDAVDAEAHENG